MNEQWTQFTNLRVQNNPRLVDMPLKSIDQSADITSLKFEKENLSSYLQPGYIMPLNIIKFICVNLVESRNFKGTPCSEKKKKD